MRALKVAEDIVPVGEFKGQAARWLGMPLKADGRGHHPKRQTGRVLVSPSEYDRLTERQRFLESVALGLADAEAGRTMNTKELSAATGRAAPARAVALKVIWTEQALVRLIEIQDFIAQSNPLRRSA